ncbi:MAG: phosphonate transport system substrate-binding protein [Oleiphilaceae bacterium]|jgi:phosphonate transport system substrate-binding protein
MTPFILRRALLSICFILLSFSVNNAHSRTFTFTAIPDQDQTRLQQRFDKVATYLEKTLQIEVSYIPVKSYSAAITAFRNNQVQLAWFGGLSGVQARRLVPGSLAIAQGEEDQYFKSVIIANAKTKLTNSDTLPSSPEKYSLAFGSKGSTSGRLMPEFYLQEHYKKPSDLLFKRVGFSGDHSRTIALVQTGAYDLGALNYKVWEQSLSDGLIDLKQVNVIWTTPDYPDYQWTIRGDINEFWGDDFIEKVQKALISMDDPELLNAFPRSKFVKAQSSDYEVILQTAKSIGLID